MGALQLSAINYRPSQLRQEAFTVPSDSTRTLSASRDHATRATRDRAGEGGTRGARARAASVTGVFAEPGKHSEVFGDPILRQQGRLLYTPTSCFPQLLTCRQPTTA